jgi:hypothetical protein
MKKRTRMSSKTLEDALVVSEKRLRTVSNGILSQALPTQAGIWADEGEAFCGIIVFDVTGERRTAVFAITHESEVNVLELWKAQRILDALNNVSSYMMDGVNIACQKDEPVEMSEDRASSLALLMLDIGLDAFDEMQKAPLPLADIVNLLSDLKRAGLTLVTDSLTDAVEAGRLEYSPDLENFGVEHPRVRRQRFAREQAFLHGLSSHLHAFLVRRIPDTGALERLQANALDVRKRGTMEEDLIVGTAALMLLRDEHAAANHLRRLFPGYIQVTTPTMSRKKAAQFVGRFCRDHFESKRTVREYVGVLSKLLIDIENGDLPITDNL